MMRRAILVLVTWVVLLGCGGDPRTRPATLSYLLPAIFEPNCASSGCHSTFAHAAGLVLEGDPTLVREYLVSSSLVYPAEPDGSPLLNYLTGAYGVPRMPPAAPLPDGDVEFIRRWIVSGAPP